MSGSLQLWYEQTFALSRRQTGSAPAQFLFQLWSVVKIRSSNNSAALQLTIPSSPQTGELDPSRVGSSAEYNSIAGFGAPANQASGILLSIITKCHS